MSSVPLCFQKKLDLKLSMSFKGCLFNQLVVILEDHRHVIIGEVSPKYIVNDKPMTPESVRVFLQPTEGFELLKFSPICKHRGV